MFVVILHDRHTDDGISLHKTREGADARLEEFKASYVGRYDWEYVWKNEVTSADWVAFWTTDDDGPDARIEEHEVER